MELLRPALLDVADDPADELLGECGRPDETASGRPDPAAEQVHRSAGSRLLGRHRRAVARHLDLDDDSSSPRRARLFVADTAREWGFDAVRDDAMLVASELVGNAVAHARTPCRLALRLDALGLTVTVHDHDFRAWLVPLNCGATGHRDHGLFLVASISRAWGVSPTETGKSVWALLPFPGGA
jgi:hypothetical protein